jgi:ABC-type amino acid transport substrate-binding protein
MWMTAISIQARAKHTTQKYLMLGFVLLNFALTGCDRPGHARLHDERIEKQWVMGVSPDYPPFEFSKGGTTVGYDIDLAQALAKEAGVSLVIQDLDFSSLIPSLQSGRIDFAMSSISANEERKKNVDFSDPYFLSSFALLTREDGSVVQESDLPGKIVGVQLGSTMEKHAKILKERHPGMEVVSLSRNPILIQELKSKRLDGVLVEDLQAAAFVVANPHLKFVSLSNSGDGYSIAFRKQKNLPKTASEGSFLHAPLRDRMNAALKKLKADGTLDELKNKWLLKKL